MKTDLLHHRRTCLSGRGQRVLHRFLFGHQLRSSPERRFTKKARWSTDGLPVIKTASAFGLYGVLISRTWTDGGGKRSPSTANAILRPLPYRALWERSQGTVATQTQRGRLPPQPNSFGSATTITLGAPIGTGEASPLRVATGGDAN